MGAEQSTPADAGGAGSSNKPVPRALVVCGPSGVGKGTLIKKLMDGPDADRVAFSVSTTTRKPRPGEIEGVHYFFTSPEAFAAADAANEFLEAAEVHGNHYATSRAAVQAIADEGRVAVLDVDVQGARSVRRSGLPALFVFVAPPSLEELERRLRGRGTETPASMGRRIANARSEVASLNEHGLFDYLLVNDDLDAAASELQRIAHRALLGLPAEPGKVPDEVRFEDDNSNDSASHTATANESGVLAPSTSNAAAAAAAGIEAAASLPEVGSGALVASSPARRVSTSGLGLPIANGTHVRGTALDSVLNAGQSEQQQQKQQYQQQQQPEQVHVHDNVQSSPASQEQQQKLQQQQQQQQKQQQQQQQFQQQHQQHHTALPLGPSGAVAAAPMASGLDAWRGRVALVTGASSGIGWAVCEALARSGLRVVAVARRRERLTALQARVLGPDVGMAPSDFLPVVCDVTKEAEVAALPKIVLKHWPEAGVDVLVNNAGLSRNNASLFSGDTSSWLEMVSTNLLGNCMATRMAVQDMRRRGQWGHIINLVGLSGHRIPDAPAGGTFFAATKHAVRAVTEGLRQEARGAGVPLRVTGISPGLVETEFFTVRAFGDASAAAAVTNSMRCLDPADVANAVLWALSAPAHMEVNDIIIRPTQQMI